MLQSVIWWVGIVLALLILVGGYRARLLFRYPFFYAYAASVFFVWTVLYFPYILRSPSYNSWYWGAEFLTLVVGYGILLEILNHVLGPYPGAAKFARTIGVIAFALVVCFAWLYPRLFPQWSAGTSVEFERDLRTVQALFLGGLLVVVSYYRIAISRNMKGLIAGYGLYIATSLVTLALRSYAGMSFDTFWKIAEPLSYDISLLIWLVALRSYSPTPVPYSGINLDANYQELVTRTRSAVRSHFRKTARP
ncbi:MAG TPA: hypothetical protein VIY66_10060 [Candidatus Acidoferrales bacterium]